jgi:hypothetical protein
MGYIKMNKIFITTLVLAVFATGNLCAKPVKTAKQNLKMCHTPSGKKVSCKTLEEAKKVLALKKLTAQNKALKAELAATRKAELATAARGEEPVIIAATTPAAATATNTATTTTAAVETQKLAPVTYVSVPAPSTTPAATVKTEVAKEEQSYFEKNFAADVENSLSTSFNGDSNPLYNNVKMVFKYNLTEHVSLKTEPNVSWKWTNNTQNASSFTFNDLSLVVNDWAIYKYKPADLTVDGNFIVLLPTSVASRNAGVISTIIANVGIQKDISGGDGNIVFRPEFAFALRKYTTAAPTANTQSEFNSLSASNVNAQVGDGDASYELLSPYQQFTINVGTTFWHKIYGGLSCSVWFKFVTAKYYGDYVWDDSGAIETVTPESWSNALEFAQELKYEFNNHWSMKTGLSSYGAVSGYRPFSASGTNNLTWWLTVMFDFYNKASM